MRLSNNLPLLRRFLILGVLVSSLGVALMSDGYIEVARAWGCCCDCEAAEQQCYEPGHNGFPTSWDCIQGSGVLYCYRTCSYDPEVCADPSCY